MLDLRWTRVGSAVYKRHEQRSSFLAALDQRIFDPIKPSHEGIFGNCASGHAFYLSDPKRERTTGALRRSSARQGDRVERSQTGRDADASVRPG